MKCNEKQALEKYFDLTPREISELDDAAKFLQVSLKTFIQLALTKTALQINNNAEGR